MQFNFNSSPLFGKVNNANQNAKPTFWDNVLYGKSCDFCNYGPAEANRRAREKGRENMVKLKDSVEGFFSSQK